MSVTSRAAVKKQALELNKTGRVNCALEKTNQNLSDEICRLKVAALRLDIVFDVHCDQYILKCAQLYDLA